MVEVGEDEMLNGVVENGSSERENSENRIFIETSNMEKQEESFYTVIHRLFSQIFFPDPHSQASLVRRINRSLNENSPALKEASINSTRNLLVWMRRGWIGFFLTVWLAVKKSLDLTKRSLSVTGTALSAYSSARHGHHRHRENQIKS